MDLTSPVRPLSAAVNAVARLVPGAALRLRAAAGGLEVAAGDRDLSVRLTCPATAHVDGEVLVPAAPLAETVKMLDTDRVRLVVEGSRLAVRVEGARFALPLLDGGARVEPAQPPRLSEVDGSLFAAAVRTVAGTAAKDDPLPVFTGVRVQTEGDELVLTASDRYRMAVARIRLRAAWGPLDVLVPARLLTEATRQASGPVSLHADAAHFGLGWPGGTLTTAVLDAGFLSADTIPRNAVDTELSLPADALAAAVRRVGVYAEDRRVLTLEVGDSHVRLASTRADTGEAEETLKANVSGGRTSPSFQARYLLDALAPFSGATVRLAIQPGLRACVVRAVEEQEVDLTYLLMPILPR
ncbi:DNA polymerase III subunit beta [Amycolatopsis sp. FDAARGOS 1241]|uniref:DNA polymerase III subunit beta n=1 Tax=Amycolatopsis sp. FDAARGOS 1241 TaxID=2778070 RepID=UPI00194F06B3|nr:DNA polymerase III subunit beta [Amycolatopsis sp. FDAARGOS 1241]QRP46537.1 DNA polymerase III subunit beta [Amycolatopsis sp. FDAARGOS 1241]